MNDSRILVVAAHPDDEILGVGGTVRRHVMEGHHVHSVVVCEGETVRYRNGDVPQEEMGRKAASVLGSEIEFLRFPDQHLEEVLLTKLITAVEERVRELKPRIVYTQFIGDVNLDHKRLFDAVLVATRPMAGSIEAVYAFETCSSTEWGWPQIFRPDTFVDISQTLDTKLQAMACYESEVKQWPHPRSLESLRYRANYFGSMACMHAAEPFVTIRAYRRQGCPC